MAQDLARSKGIELPAVMQTGGWRSETTVARYTARETAARRAGREGYARVPDAAGVPRAKFPISRGPPIDDLRCRRVAPRHRLYAFLRAAGTSASEPRTAPYAALRAPPGRVRHGEGWRGFDEGAGARHASLRPARSSHRLPESPGDSEPEIIG